MASPVALVRPKGRGNRTGTALTTPTALLFVLPALVLFAVLILYPMVTALSYSFFEWQGTSQSGFAGFANYATLLFQEPYASSLWNAFGHNLLLFLGAIVFQNSLGLGIATLLHRRRRTKRLFQTIFALPYLVSPMVIGYLWSLMLSPLFGPVNAILRGVGLESMALPWLGDPKLAIWVIVFVSAWQWIGFPILLYGAALGGIPEEIEEAASLDGASAGKRFRFITIPMLVPTIGIITVLTFIGSMEAMPIPFALAGSNGAPAGSTDVMMLLFYRTAFESGNANSIGISSALATVLFLFILLISVVITSTMRRAERKLF
ncbi:carbohydrate ABC transporter permease [Microbacterium sp. JB110]|uniref:carbohydrate ABC transporter permease n=1 Tax=Microbacterium sp. JB110 TaxID=2024477 RepID=UPI00097ED194|nr:sugar ABC transporter permease [Microbacterium sp. JB110]RCS61837.1 sugar ABC transporter permease [Microbacterium sp. JB110]SJM66160.1 N-Acetyl-D-glucosamine ABC transport system, permease protein 1 [Frigoribacterium sp. JB110]